MILLLSSLIFAQDTNEITISAPVGITLEDIGGVYDINFEPISDLQVFVEPEPKIVQSEGESSAKIVTEKNSLAIKANVTLAGFSSLTLLNENSFMVAFRAYESSRVHHLKSFNPNKTLAPNAYWYISAIHIGRLHEKACFGSATLLQGEIGYEAIVKLGAVETETETVNLLCNSRALGLEVENTKAYYSSETLDDNLFIEKGSERPILVTFKRVSEENLNLVSNKDLFLTRFKIDKESYYEPSTRPEIYIKITKNDESLYSQEFDNSHEESLNSKILNFKDIQEDERFKVKVLELDGISRNDLILEEVVNPTDILKEQKSGKWLLQDERKEFDLEFELRDPKSKVQRTRRTSSKSYSRTKSKSNSFLGKSIQLIDLTRSKRIKVERCTSGSSKKGIRVSFKLTEPEDCLITFQPSGKSIVVPIKKSKLVCKDLGSRFTCS